MANILDVDSMELLFFDTFAHEGCDDYNLDLVQFPRPVFINEVRVIPLGTKVQADFPGGVRLGATNPSQFRVDFFVNDLSKSGASTFHQLGGLDYKHNVEIQLLCPNVIPTDGLVLQGLYTTITLAIYGSLAKVTREKVQSPPPPPPPPPPPVAVKSKINTGISESEIKQEESATEVWSRESDKISVQKSEVRSCSPEPSPQYPIPTVPSTHPQSEYDQWPEPESRSHEYSVISSVSEGSHKRKDERSHSKSRETSRDERRESASGGVGGTYKDPDKSDRERDREKSTRDRDRNVDDRGERDRNRDRDRDGKGSRASRERQEGGSHSSHREHRGIRTPPGTPIRRHPPSPKERHRPRTPLTPHPETIESACIKPNSPVMPHPPVTIVETIKDEIFEPLTPEATLTDQLEMLSDGELRDTNCPDYYEEIVSEEEEMFDGEEPMEFQNEMEYELGDDAYITAFNPFNCETSPPLYFNDPSLTEYEIEINKKVVFDVGESERISHLIKEGQEKRLSERWVEILELLPSLALQMTPVQQDECIDVLVDWVCDALNFHLALQQPQAVFKIRHLKAGIKLASTIFKFSRRHSVKLLEREVQKKLIRLYCEEYMALSLKLLILKALDDSTRFKEGMEAFLRKSHSGMTEEGMDNSKLDEFSDYKTGYQMVLDIVLTKQMTRSAVAVTSILKKIHFYETLEKLSVLTEEISINFSKFTWPPKEESDKVNYERDNSLGIVGGLKSWVDANKVELKSIVTCLREIQTIYSFAQHLIPSRSLPVKTQFELQRNCVNPFPGVYSLFNDCGFLEILFLLLSFPPTVTQPTIVWTIKDILSEMLTSQHGMLYLLSHHETTNAIIRVLLQCAEDGRDDIPYDSALQELGQQMVHYLHVLQCIDNLLAETPPGQRCREIDDPDILSNLHDLYTMTFTSQGQSAVSNIFGMARNLEAIIPFIQFAGDEDHDLKLKKSSCMGYAVELLLVTMRLCESVEHLEKFSERLLIIASQESNPKIQELGLWLSPLRKMPTFTYQEIPQLCLTVKASLENVLSFPEELVTALRILRYLVVPSYATNSANRIEGFQEELKYKYAILQLYANDGLSLLLTILEKICDAYNYPFLHASSFVGQKGVLLIAVTKPTVSLILHIISYIIYCRRNEFNDLASIPILMNIYSLLSFFPAVSIQSSTVQTIQSDIIDVLAAFTQPVVEVTESEEAALVGSLWTKMLQEVFKFISKSPSVFISSLTVLSELLPLPLPIQSHEPLSAEEVGKAINYRKFWSLHLHCLALEIQNVITTIGGDQNLQQIIRRVCVQLADLSASTSLVVIRGILDAILDILESETSESSTHFGHLTRLLNLLSFLVSQACIKIPLLHLIKGINKIDKKYCDFLPKITELLSSSSLQQSTDKPSTSQQFQECIMSIFQSLCDAEIACSGTDSQLLLPDQLTNSLPCREHMGIICSALWDHLANSYPALPSVLLTLRTLVMLTEHDYGFYHLKMNLDKYPNALYAFLTSLCQHFVRDIPDLISSLTTFLELLQLMVNSDEDPKYRSYEISSLELAHYLKWVKVPLDEAVSEGSQLSSELQVDLVKSEKVDTDEPLHPLLRMEKLLKEASREEDSLEMQAIENIRDLIILLNNSDVPSSKEKGEIQEVILPSVESLSQLFNQRVPFVVGDIDEDGLSTVFWLAQLNADDIDQENETVSTDLQALSVQVCPNFDFTVELEKLFLTKDETPGAEKSRKLSVEIGKRKYQPIINPGSKDPIRKKPFVAPMRGRGYARGGMHSSRANDPFRSRPPNTSRPPSMHVDDFVALEILQPNNPQAGTSLKREPNRVRGRGFEGSREFSTPRGRSFQTASNSYSRSEDRGGSVRGNSRAVSNPWGGDILSTSSSKPLQKFNSASPRSSSFLHPGVVDLRSDTRSSSGGRQSTSSVRLLDISVSRLTRLARPTTSTPHSGDLSSWSNVGKARDSRFPSSGRSNRNREHNRHPRSLTR